MSWSILHRGPRRIGPYEVLAKIGKGNTGSVFKARHVQTGILVAVKLLSAAAARHAVSLKRFEQEIVASHSLKHPHIVRGLDFGYEGTMPYLVMELMDGVSLSSHIKAVGRMPESEALRMATQVAQALQHAHCLGMIHRDVNPSNILLSVDGQAKLMDFGLVKSLESDLNLTASAMSLGTPCYMAPEQFDDAKRADRRCDIYGLAATLYKAITGESPYNARAYGITVRKKLNGDIVSPREIVLGLSMRVDWAILRALSVSPMMRPSSCAEFIRDLTGRELSLAAEPAQHSAHLGSGNVERRTAIRYPCRLQNICSMASSKGQKPWGAEMRDISVNGVGLVLDRRFERGTILMVEWQQTMEDSMGSMMARVVRAQAQESKQWLLGCQLNQNLGDEEVRALLARSHPVRT